MSDRKFSDGTRIETPDGTAEVVGVHSSRDGRIVYGVKYHDVAGTPTSTLAEEEIENNSEIEVLD